MVCYTRFYHKFLLQYIGGTHHHASLSFCFSYALYSFGYLDIVAWLTDSLTWKLGGYSETAFGQKQGES